MAGQGRVHQLRGFSKLSFVTLTEIFEQIANFFQFQQIHACMTSAPQLNEPSTKVNAHNKPVNALPRPSKD
eukprot:m.169987 g.169987  ORF g.169987 m.169987 type:complete len:71 (+) comp39023_c1_seq6:373-585(+)